MISDPLVQSIIIEEIGIASILAFIYIVARIRHTMDYAKSGLSFILLTAFMLAIPVMQYATLRPYQPVSIATSIILAAVVFPLYGIIKKYFVRIELAFSASRYGLFSLLGFVFCYLILFMVTVDGIDYFFEGLVSPQSIILTPEFISIGIPTLVFLILFAYRIGDRFKSSPLDFLRKISDDLITLSLTVLLLSFVAGVSGAQLVKSPIEVSFDSSTVGLAAGFLAIGVEYTTVRLAKAMQEARPGLSIDETIDQFLGPLRRPASNDQRTLDDFEKPKERRRAPSRGFWGRADAKHSIKLGKRRLKPSTMFTISLLLVVSLLFYASVAPVETSLLVQGVEIHASIVGQSATSKATFTTSEGMQDAAAGHTYAIPIVNVTTFNSTFIAPLSDRYSSLNSSTYVVHDTGDYLLLALDRVVINGSFTTNLLEHPARNQTDNSEFNYIGIFGDAEMYYSLANSGYENITVLSETTISGTNTPVTKIMYANDSSGNTVLLEFQDSGDIVSLQTLTITTTNSQIYSSINSLFLQAKVPIVLSFSDANPKPNFRVG
jgi:hypothetical protein